MGQGESWEMHRSLIRKIMQYVRHLKIYMIISDDISDHLLILPLNFPQILSPFESSGHLASSWRRSGSSAYVADVAVSSTAWLQIYNG